MSQPNRPVPPPPKQAFRGDSDDEDDEEEKEKRENDTPPLRQGNNEEENKHESINSSDDSDEVFNSRELVDIIPKEEEEEAKNEENEDTPPPQQLRQRRVSYGKIPVPPMAVTIESIQDAAQQSRENGEEVEVRKPVDPRRSSVSLDVFRSFKDPHDKKNMPAKDKTIYVEGSNGKFREMKKGLFWDKTRTNPSESVPSEKDEEESVIPYLLKAPGQAYRTQRVYNQIANIIQGFLAGISLMLAIFSFNLEPEILLSGYRYMSLPIHAAFLLAFTVGFVSSIDRTGIYEMEHFITKSKWIASIYNNGLITFIVWFIGLISTLLCIQLESQLAFAPTQVPDYNLVHHWRIFNVFRALTAALVFLLLAFRPDSDTLAKELKQAIFDQLDIVTTDPERRQIILTAMKITT